MTMNKFWTRTAYIETANQLSEVFTVPAGYSFICYSKQVTGASGTVQISDSNGVLATLSTGERQNVKEVFEGGETISVTGTATGMTLEMKLLILDSNGVPWTLDWDWGDSSSSSSEPSSSSAGGGGGGGSVVFTVTADEGLATEFPNAPNTNCNGGYYDTGTTTQGAITTHPVYTNGNGWYVYVKVVDGGQNYWWIGPSTNGSVGTFQTTGNFSQVPATGTYNAMGYTITIS